METGYLGILTIRHQAGNSLIDVKHTNRLYDSKEEAIEGARELGSQIEHKYTVYQNHEYSGIEINKQEWLYLHFPHYANAVDYFIHGQKSGPLEDVFKERFVKTENGENIYTILSHMMLDHEKNHKEFMDDLNTEIYSLLRNDPNY